MSVFIMQKGSIRPPNHLFFFLHFGCSQNAMLTAKAMNSKDSKLAEFADDYFKYSLSKLMLAVKV